MADLTFGKELGMLRGESGREMPGILDANIYLSSVVGSELLHGAGLCLELNQC
jgi:hypothetical protein